MVTKVKKEDEDVRDFADSLEIEFKASGDDKTKKEILQLIYLRDIKRILEGQARKV